MEKENPFESEKEKHFLFSIVVCEKSIRKRIINSSELWWVAFARKANFQDFNFFYILFVWKNLKGFKKRKVNENSVEINKVEKLWIKRKEIKKLRETKKKKVQVKSLGKVCGNKKKRNIFWLWI